MRSQLQEKTSARLPSRSDRGRLEETLTGILLSAPLWFRLGKRRLAIQPETLGSTAMTGLLLRDLDIDGALLEQAPMLEALRICGEERRKVAEIIAVSTLRGNGCLDPEKRRRRGRLLLRNLDREGLAELLTVVLNRTRWLRAVEDCGLRDEQELRGKIASLREETGRTLGFGGKSIFGTLVDAACARYGWSYDRVVWETPLDALRMMLADSVGSVCLSEEEEQKLGIRSGAGWIDGDSADIETLRNL